MFDKLERYSYARVNLEFLITAGRATEICSLNLGVFEARSVHRLSVSRSWLLLIRYDVDGKNQPGSDALRLRFNPGCSHLDQETQLLECRDVWISFVNREQEIERISIGGERVPMRNARFTLRCSDRV